MAKLSPDEYSSLLSDILELRKKYGDLVFQVSLERPDGIDDIIFKQIGSIENALANPNSGIIVKANQNMERINSLKYEYNDEIGEINKKIDELEEVKGDVINLKSFQETITKGLWIVFSLVLTSAASIIGLYMFGGQ